MLTVAASFSPGPRLRRARVLSAWVTRRSLVLLSCWLRPRQRAANPDCAPSHFTDGICSLSGEEVTACSVISSSAFPFLSLTAAPRPASAHLLRGSRPPAACGLIGPYIPASDARLAATDCSPANAVA